MKIEVNKVRNAYNVEVNMMCGSCKFRQLSDGVRTCENSGEQVARRHCCQDWQMSEGMQQAGSAMGRVKRRAYQRYLVDAYWRDLMWGRPVRPVEQIRKEYVEEYGSPYCNG